MKKYLVDDTEYYVRMEGSGPILLMAHGFPFDSQLYEPVVGRLSERFTCVVPDLRGFGKTKLGANGHNQHGVPRVKMGRYADDLAILVSEIACQRKHKGEKIVLCGLSMGGYIALAFERRRPEWLLGLVFCDSNATKDPPERAKSRLELADSITQFELDSLADSMIANVLAPATIKNQPDVVAAMREMIMRQSPESVAAGSRGIAVRSDSTETLRQIEAPTLVLGGEFDALSPPALLDQIAEQLPNATRATIPDAGHVPPMENPDAFVDAILRWYDAKIVPEKVSA